MSAMNEETLQQALANSQNLGEMTDADAVGTVGSPDCGDMVRMWIKYREQDGKKVIDKAGPIGFNDQKGPYFKFGLYKGWRDRKNPAGVVSSRTLYHDEIRVAAGPDKYSAVAPGGRRPAAPGAVRTQR